MKKLSFSILLGIFGFLSIYASSDVDFTIIDLKCYNKRPSDGQAGYCGWNPMTYNCECMVS